MLADDEDSPFNMDPEDDPTKIEELYEEVDDSFVIGALINAIVSPELDSPTYTLSSGRYWDICWLYSALFILSLSLATLVIWIPLEFDSGRGIHAQFSG